MRTVFMPCDSCKIDRLMLISSDGCTLRCLACGWAYKRPMVDSPPL